MSVVDLHYAVQDAAALLDARNIGPITTAQLRRVERFLKRALRLTRVEIERAERRDRAAFIRRERMLARAKPTPK